MDGRKRPENLDDYTIEDFITTQNGNWPNLDRAFNEDNEHDTATIKKEVSTSKLDTRVNLPEYGADFSEKLPFEEFDNKLVNFCDRLYTNMAAADPDYYDRLEKSWFENVLAKSKKGTHQVVVKPSVESVRSAVMYKPADIPLPFDSTGGLGVTLTLPVNVTDIMVSVLEITERKTRYIENLLLSAASKSIISKLFWSVLIRFYRIQVQNTFNAHANDINRKALDRLLDQLSWEYANFQSKFQNDDVFMVYCVLVSQVVFMIFYKSFQTTKFGMNALIGVTIVLFEWLCGLRPRLDLLKMYPMEKLTGAVLHENEPVPYGLQNVLKANFPKGDYRRNTGNGTIILGMMSGLLDRYCQRTKTSGVGEIIGILTKRHIQRTLI